MFKRFLVPMLLLGVGGWYFFTRYDISGWDGLKITAKGTTNASANGQFGTDWAEVPPVVRTGSTVRVASFNVEVFGKTKLAKPQVLLKLAQIVRQFDVIALQDIQAEVPALLPKFIEAVNQSGRHYDFVLSQPLGRRKGERLAFLFDRASVEVDRSQLYVVNDPDDLIDIEPFVAWFRVRGPEQQQALTFSIVNVHVSQPAAAQELGLMDDVMREVLNDGRNEDDVLIVGDFGITPKRIIDSIQSDGINWAIQQKMLPSWQNMQTDNIGFHSAATSEFTGQAGVIDFLRKFNMTTSEAAEISSHLPVWAEFSIYEGGKPGVTL